MTLLLRQVNQNKWLRLPQQFEWLKENDIVHADPVTDLRTSDNTLSVWEVRDDKSNLDDVVTAIAATRQRVDKLDFVLFPPGYLEEIGIRSVKTRGRTPYENANELHIDLIELSASRLAQLARRILENAQPERFQEFRVKDLLTSSLQNGKLTRDSLPTTLQAQLE